MYLSHWLLLTCNVGVFGQLLSSEPITTQVESFSSGSPTIPYAPPSPPSPGKRMAHQKRQFQASHHHQGGTHDCWDGSTTDPYCNTPAPTGEVSGSSEYPTLDKQDGFPGSEFKPHPKPDPDWDSKPSTEAPTIEPPFATGAQTPVIHTASGSTVSPGTTNAVTSASNATTQMPGSASPVPQSLEPSTGTTTVQGPNVSTAVPLVTGVSPLLGSTTTVLAVKTPAPTPSSETPMVSSTSTSLSITAGTNATTTTSPTPAPSTASAAQPPTVTASQATVANGTTQGPCVDTVDNCALYGKQACTTEVYKPWATAHCSRFCGFCTPVTLTPFECKDKVANCHEFESGDLCTADAYYAWARENCYAYCGFSPCESSDSHLSEEFDIIMSDLAANNYNVTSVN